MARVGVGEQQVQLALAQLGLDRAQLSGDLLLQVGVALRQLVELDEVPRASLELLPRRGELPVLERLSGLVARGRGVVPGAGPG